MKIMRKSVALLIMPMAALGLLSACVSSPSSSPSAQPAEQTAAPVTLPEDTVHAAAVVAEMQGHLFSSFTLWQTGENGIADAHARHPLAEGLPNLKDVLTGEEIDALTADIEAYSAAIETTPDDAAAVEAAYTTVLAALDETTQTLAGDLNSDATFRAAVLRDLLNTIEHEYAEAVADGVVIEPAEYQDGFGFFNVAKQRYADLTIENQQIVDQLSALDAVFTTVMPPSAAASVADVESAVDAINAQLTEHFGLAEMVESTPAEVIEDIRGRVAQALQYYETGDADEAYEQAADAYLEGFEYIEDDLMQAGEQELMESMELQFKELRDAIQAGEPQADVRQIADEINAALDQVATIVENNE